MMVEEREYRFRSDDVALVKFEGIETAERARAA